MRDFHFRIPEPVGDKKITFIDMLQLNADMPKGYILISLLIFIGYKSNAQSGKSGQVSYVAKFFDPTKNEYISWGNKWPDIKVLFRDSLLVEEYKVIEIEAIDNKPERWFSSIQKYTLVDMSTRWCYEYRNFSDTAKLLLMYKLEDTSWVSGGSMYTVILNIPRTEPPLRLADTVIEKVNYRRLLFTNSSPRERNPNWMVYFRCDQKRSVINLFSKYVEQDSCNLVRFDQIPTISSPVGFSVETRFDRNYLTPEEIKVFDAWRKNAERLGSSQ